TRRCTKSGTHWASFPPIPPTGPITRARTKSAGVPHSPAVRPRGSRAWHPVAAEDRRTPRRPAATARSDSRSRQPAGTPARAQTRAASRSEIARDIPERSRKERNSLWRGPEFHTPPPETTTSAKTRRSRKNGTGAANLCECSSYIRFIAQRDAPNSPPPDSAHEKLTARSSRMKTLTFGRSGFFPAGHDARSTWLLAMHLWSRAAPRGIFGGNSFRHAAASALGGSRGGFQVPSGTTRT